MTEVLLNQRAPRCTLECGVTTGNELHIFQGTGQHGTWQTNSCQESHRYFKLLRKSTTEQTRQVNAYTHPKGTKKINEISKPLCCSFLLKQFWTPRTLSTIMQLQRSIAQQVLVSKHSAEIANILLPLPTGLAGDTVCILQVSTEDCKRRRSAWTGEEIQTSICRTNTFPSPSTSCKDALPC